ncbi:hypothetical protein PENTCL1PPCAC_5074, partial [Pristionchus entomophagus]
IQGQPIIIHDDEQQSYWTSKMTTDFHLLRTGIVCNFTTWRYEWTDGSAIDYKPPVYTSDLDKTCKSGCVWDIHLDGYWGFGCSNKNVYMYNIFCTTQPHQPVPSNDGCDIFEDDSDDRVCYQMGVTAENWQDAQLICRSFGADVASIHSQQENSFVRRLAVSKGAVGGIFLGATITGKSNDYGWIDGSNWDYDNFYPGFPLNELGDCILMDTGGTSAEWANVDENYTTPVCSSGPWKEGQIICSPGFPFDASTPCDFILSVDVGKTVKLEVLVIEANSCCDHLVVYENYFGANVIAK